MDAVVVVSAPGPIQRERVLAREGMSEAKLDGILARQMADEEKRAKAHFVVDTAQGFEHARAQVRDIIAKLRAGWARP
jgi:dephospho-CoA kinase